MTTHDQLLSPHVAAKGEPVTGLITWVRCFGRRIVAWADACANYSAAAAMYEQLSALSDAELARRGLSRATLSDHVRATAAARDELRTGCAIAETGKNKPA